MAPSFRGNFVESLSGEVSNPSGDLFLERTRNCLDKEIKSKRSDHFFSGCKWTNSSQDSLTLMGSESPIIPASYQSCRVVSNDDE